MVTGQGDTCITVVKLHDPVYNILMADMTDSHPSILLVHNCRLL